MIPRHLISAALVLLAVIIAAPASTEQPVKAAPDQNRVAELGEYRIGPEDVLQISVWKNEAVSRTVSVRPDGKISLPLLNDVQAAGRTPMEVRDFLMKRLVEYTPAPEVSVIVQEVRSFKVSVMGEVKGTGLYELKSWTTVLDVLAKVGGFSEFASRSRIVVLRREGKTVKRIPFNYNKAIAEGGEQENFYLRPGDIVVVP
ncbi:MAG: polysaccharide export protein [Acidobacteria bacterium]|nr:polysaccharide export protein [Acidobacteriota bacterium]